MSEFSDTSEINSFGSLHKDLANTPQPEPYNKYLFDEIDDSDDKEENNQQNVPVKNAISVSSNSEDNEVENNGFKNEEEKQENNHNKEEDNIEIKIENSEAKNIVNTENTKENKDVEHKDEVTDKGVIEHMAEIAHKEKDQKKEEEDDGSDDNDDSDTALNLHDYIINSYILIANLPDNDPKTLFKGSILLTGNRKFKGIIASQTELVNKILNESIKYDDVNKKYLLNEESKFLKKFLNGISENHKKIIFDMLNEYCNAMLLSTYEKNKNISLINKRLFGLISEILIGKAGELTNNSLFKKKYNENIVKIQNFIVKSVCLEDEIQFGTMENIKGINDKQALPISAEEQKNYANAEFAKIVIPEISRNNKNIIKLIESDESIHVTADFEYSKLKQIQIAEKEAVKQFLFTQKEREYIPYEHIAEGVSFDDFPDPYKKYIANHYNSLYFQHHADVFAPDGSRVIEFGIDNVSFDMNLSVVASDKFNYLDFSNCIGKNPGPIVGCLNYIKEHPELGITKGNCLDVFSFYDKNKRRITDKVKMYDYLKKHLSLQDSEGKPLGHFTANGQDIIEEYFGFDNKVILSSNLNEVNSDLKNKNTIGIGF